MNSLESKLLIFLEIAGFLVSTYLLTSKYWGVELICGVSSCGVVNNSGYSSIMGIPVAWLGLLFYLVCIAVTLAKRNSMLFYISICGLLFSIYFTSIEAFVIHAWCQWCIFSAWLSASIFIISLNRFIKDRTDCKTFSKLRNDLVRRLEL